MRASFTFANRLAVVPLYALAPGALASTAAAPAGVGAGNVAQVVFGLAVVLALVAGAAWLLRRFSGVPGSGSGLVRVLGGAAVGQRERVIVVEVGATWLVVGVAPGQVRTLHTMPKTELAPAAEAQPVSAPNFAAWLRKTMEARKHG